MKNQDAARFAERWEQLLAREDLESQRISYTAMAGSAKAPRRKSREQAEAESLALSGARIIA